MSAPFIPGAAAWCVRFPAAAAVGATALLEFGEQGRVAVAEAMSSDALRGERDALLILHLPGGSASPPAARQAAEAWIAGPGVVDLVLQSDRILWRLGRAVVIGAASDFDAYLRGLSSFCFYESELRRVEADLAAWWPVAQADVGLTHRVDTAAVRRWSHVGEMTEAITGARFRHVAIEGPLEKGPDALPGLARRLFNELALRGEVAHRLERLDDKIDTVADLYELANDRISEFSYFRREYVLEFLIIGVLALEVLLLLYELI
jgi:hypothetical protein